jgi:uncharacterized membrane protein
MRIESKRRNPNPRNLYITTLTMNLMSLLSLFRGNSKKDSKLRSALEVTLDVAIGCIIATMMNYTILPLYIDVIESGELFGMLQITAWYVIASYIRKYTIRRWFVNLKRSRKKTRS